MQIFLIITFVVTIFSRVIYSGRYLENNGYTYYLSYPTKLNWYRAQRYCAYYGMLLEDIPHEEENSRLLQVIDFFIRNASVTGAMNIWLGGSELGSKGEYYWENTGHPIHFTSWGPSEPNNVGNNQDCITMWKDYNYKWSDQDCKISYHFICRDKTILVNNSRDRHHNGCNSTEQRISSQIDV